MKVLMVAAATLGALLPGASQSWTETAPPAVASSCEVSRFWSAIDEGALDTEAPDGTSRVTVEVGCGFAGLPGARVAVWGPDGLTVAQAQVVGLRRAAGEVHLALDPAQSRAIAAESGPWSVTVQQTSPRWDRLLDEVSAARQRLRGQGGTGE